jgi:Flp pilus assembly protein TadG
MSFARFFKDHQGGTVPLMALALIPIMGGIGAAIDYSRAAAVRTSMQSALDATALMLSKEAQGAANPALEQKATAYFNAIFKEPKATNVAVHALLTQTAAGSFNLKVSGTASVSTVFSQVLGQSLFDVGATSEVLWGMKKLNLALALDNTGSMASSAKMTELKKAAKSLLTTLKTAEKVPGDIKVSIVPFAVDVNVGAGNVGASWIDWAHWDEQNGSCSSRDYDTYAECVDARKTWTPKNRSNWNGCVKDRDQNDDVLNTATGSTAATKYRAHQASACPAAMMPLSSDWTALNNKIDAMTPTGNTNVTIGMQMAWQTLTNSEPFNAPAAAADLDKVIILLTDGQNTQNRWSSSTSSIDARTERVCANIKLANVKLYTVRVIDGNATLLKNCASKPDMYYDVEQAAELNNVFSSIAQNLANLRVAK